MLTNLLTSAISMSSMTQINTVEELFSFCIQKEGEKRMGFHKSELGPQLIKLLCVEEESQHNTVSITVEGEDGGQGGSTIWGCHITNNVISYDLEFATFAPDLAADDCDVFIDIRRCTLGNLNRLSAKADGNP